LACQAIQRAIQRDFLLYRERKLIERFFNKIRRFRTIATPLRQIFLAAVQLGLGYHLLK